MLAWESTPLRNQITPPRGSLGTLCSGSHRDPYSNDVAVGAEKLPAMHVTQLTAASSVAPRGTEPLDPKFFANAAFQARFPGAFALQEQSLLFVKRATAKTFIDGDRLIALVGNDAALKKAVKDFPSLADAERIHVMRKLFTLIVRASGLAAPELVLDNAAQRSTFFEFDPRVGGPGKVILNPAKLFAGKNPYDALLLLVHETRHSFQFQIAFGPVGAGEPILKDGWRSGYLAQRQIFDQSLKPSFCDFLTLNQEYEAFLFGNYVLETLTDGAVDTGGMGTYASQYVPGKGLKIDLVALADKVGTGKLLDAFNELEKEQYRER